MGRDTKISWADHTANFFVGCSKVAQGCLHCYASDYARRFGMDVWGPRKPRRYVASAEGLVRSVQHTARAQEFRPRVFVSSLSDFFDDGQLRVIDHHGRALYRAPSGEITAHPASDKRGPLPGYEVLTVEHVRQRAWELIDASPDVDFLILTKRPQHTGELWGRSEARANVLLGASASTQAEANEALEQLRRHRHLARHTFLSLEPLLEPIVLDPPELPDWIIIGGESGPHARECRVAWIRAMVAQLTPTTARVFVKQLGDHVPDRGAIPQSPKGGDAATWPPDLRVQQTLQLRRS